MSDLFGKSHSGTEAIAFGARALNSELFRELFREGMALVEETASYLDGDGRIESRNLSRAATLSYSTESMRLTTRLMQIASWLLMQRAVNEGEMSPEQARSEKNKVRLDFQPPVMLPQPAPNRLTRLLKRPVVPEPVSMAGMRPIFNVPQVLDSIPRLDSRSKALPLMYSAPSSAKKPCSK